VFKGQSRPEYTKSLLSAAVKTVSETTRGVGDYGRIEMYAHIIGKLDGQIRRTHPESSMLIDLMIKDILLNEPNRRVRYLSWRNSGMLDSETLTLRDAMVLTARTSQDSAKSI
jgi:hypothetical protein